MVDYQLKIADGYNIAISIPGNVTKLIPNFCDKKKLCFIMEAWTWVMTRIKTKKNT